jgi:RHS repeat-associated protein
MARVLRYVTIDAMGSVTSVLSSTGEVLERRSYDAFGQMTCTLPDGTPVATSPTGLKVGFHGQLIDELTGMYQMGYRWYSPVLGRWVSRDPIGLEGGVNVYGAFDNNPITRTDPWGKEVYVFTNDGRIERANSSRDLLHLLLNTKDGSIIRLEISGHGTERTQTLDPNNDSSIERLFIAAHSGPASGSNNIGLYLGGAGFKPEDCERIKVNKCFDGSMDVEISSLLINKMAEGSRIYLFGCRVGGHYKSCELHECQKKSPISIAEIVSLKAPKSDIYASSTATVRMRNMIMFYSNEIRWSHISLFRNGTIIEHDTHQSTYDLGER